MSTGLQAGAARHRARPHLPGEPLHQLRPGPDGLGRQRRPRRARVPLRPARTGSRSPSPSSLGAATGAGVERLLGWRLFDKSRLVLRGGDHRRLAADPPRRCWPARSRSTPADWRPTATPSRSTCGGRWAAPSSRRARSSRSSSPRRSPSALCLFLTRTRTGRAIRGAASNPDAARLAGISVRRVSLIVWVIAGSISSVAAILYAPDPARASGSATAGRGCSCAALAAALLAGMYDFRIAVAAGVGHRHHRAGDGLLHRHRRAPRPRARRRRGRRPAAARRVRCSATAAATTASSSSARCPPLPDRVRDLLAVRHAGRIGWVAPVRRRRPGAAVPRASTPRSGPCSSSSWSPSPWSAWP